MTRYVNDVVTGLSRAEAKGIISGYLSEQGFVYGGERGEGVWRRGGGILTSPQFIRTDPTDRRVHIEAWVSRFVVLPGVYVGEEPLHGWYGWAIKAALRARVTELEARLSGGRIGAPAVGPAMAPARRRVKRTYGMPSPGRPKAAESAPAPAPKPPKPPGWYRDPIGKHAWRYWEGGKWTIHTADDPETPSDTG